MARDVKGRAAKGKPTTRTYDSSKRQAQARATRHAIREAARGLFLDRGYGATTIQAIAEDAGVAVQTVYAAFRTKAAILRELLEVSIVGDDEAVPLLERDMITSIWAEPDQRARLRMHVKVTSTIQGRAAAMSVVVRDAAATDPELAEFWELGKVQRRKGMGEAAQSLAGAEGLRVPVEEAADILWVLYSPDVFIQFTRDLGWTLERYEDWLHDALERLLLP